MKKFALAAVAVLAVSAAPALAADLPVKAKPIVAPPPPAWDLAFGSALMSDYNFRGITQSNHRPSVAAYFEPRYNITKDVQLYAGVSGESISFPNRAAAEIDFYGGIRPTFDKFAFDFGAWYYYYPGGQCFSAGTFTGLTGAQACNAFGSGGNFQGGPLPNGNAMKANVSFLEVYGKLTYTFSDNFSMTGSSFYSPSVLNSGATGWYNAVNAKFTAPSSWFPKDWGGYASGDVGYWKLGTSDAFYGNVSPLGNFAGGVPYTSYWNWDAGIGITYKAFTLDLRYFGTNLNKGDCNAFTSDHTATGVANTPINAGLPGSNWCGDTVIAKFSVDTSLNNLK